MSEPIPEERCRHCGRYGPHRCPANPEAEPLPDDQVFDPGGYGRLEDQQLADRYGEPRRYSDREGRS